MSAPLCTPNQTSRLFCLQEQRRSRSAFRSDTDGTAWVPLAVLGQCVRDRQGEYLGLHRPTVFSCFLQSGELNWPAVCFPAEGADQIHAGGGGGPEVHGSPGPGAPLGYCKCSVEWTWSQLQFFHKLWSFSLTLSFLAQDEGLCENDHQLSVAGKIKKHFNTSPKVNDTTAGVSVISVSHSHKNKKKTTAVINQQLWQTFTAKNFSARGWFYWFFFVFSWMTAFLCRDLGLWISTSTRPCTG